MTIFQSNWLCVFMQSFVNSNKLHLHFKKKWRFFSDSLFQYTSNHNQFDTFYCRVLVFLCKSLRCLFGKRGVAGSIPDLDIYFNFEFSLVSRSKQLSGAHIHEFKHGTSPVVYVVRHPRNDLKSSLWLIQNRVFDAPTVYILTWPWFTVSVLTIYNKNSER